MTMTETQVSETILKRVRNLLDKAESTSFEAEQETYFAKASELMATYRIDQAMLEAAKPAEDRGKLIETRVNIGSGPYVRARLSLIGSVADASNVKLLTSTGFKGRDAILIGFESDVEATEMLYTSLLVQVTSAMMAAEVPSYESAVSFRRSFMFGYSSRVGTRLAEMNRSAEVAGSHDGDSVALVLADRSAEVADYVSRRYGKLRSLSAAAGLSRSGRDSGYDSGGSADLGGRKVGGTQKALA